jgi:hypothetical protein
VPARTKLEVASQLPVYTLSAKLYLTLFHSLYFFNVTFFLFLTHRHQEVLPLAKTVSNLWHLNQGGTEAMASVKSTPTQ